MPRYPAFTTEDHHIIADRYTGGESAISIAHDYGVTPPTILAALRRQGIIPRGRGRPSTVFNDEEKCRDIVRRHLNGDSVSHIARDYDLRVPSVWSWLKNRGLLCRRSEVALG